DYYCSSYRTGSTYVF
nr:immunoglobulin light chain junction region [Macaca mulatta]MOX71701.1 immunoglobulin light chain junction region [Macaca mulatta]MOX75268.1 immunoglobulin light chain junction region [Macaca mulatta]